MKRKYKVIISIILLILTIALAVCGVLLFNITPNSDAIGYTNTKDAFMMTGVFFIFFAAFAALIGSVAFLIYSFIDD